MSGVSITMSSVCLYDPSNPRYVWPLSGIVAPAFPYRPEGLAFRFMVCIDGGNLQEFDRLMLSVEDPDGLTFWRSEPMIFDNVLEFDGRRYLDLFILLADFVLATQGHYKFSVFLNDEPVVQTEVPSFVAQLPPQSVKGMD